MKSANISKKVPIYQIKVTLDKSQPPIWRRIQVRSDITLYKLHQILQIIMPWQEEHLHQFIIDKVLYDALDEKDLLMETRDERKYRLHELITDVGFRFKYEYDFGDSWEHILVVEKVLSFQEGVFYPVCIEGRRACPPEDIGGIFGYYNFLSIISDSKHPEYEEMREWVTKDFDPEKFNIEETNQQLRQLK